MAYNPNRLSTFSSISTSAARPANAQAAQVSTQTLLNALHTSYSGSQPYSLEASTSLVVNTWWTAASVGPDGRLGGTADLELARKAWEHARRRAEDGCIVLGYVGNVVLSLTYKYADFIRLAPSTTRRRP